MSKIQEVTKESLITSSRTVLVGLGPYAKKHYFSFFRRHSYFPEFIIDLDSRKNDIQNFLKSIHLEIPLYFVPDGCRNNTDLPEEQKTNLQSLLKKWHITHAIIATEPKAHWAYLNFFIDNGIHILVEKPLTSPPNASFCLLSADKIWTDYLDLLKKVEESPTPKLRIDLQCQRRYHPIYQFVQNQIETFVKEFDIPPTYCDIYHCDGTWNMPEEFLFRENHPYKYGYGKLLHSGYHFIDLLANLLKSSFNHCTKIPESAEIYGKGFSPYDSLEVVSQKDYERFFKHNKYNDIFNDPVAFRFPQMGELDFFSTIQLYRENKKITTCHLNLLQTGFCRRAWSDLPEDTYKSNGRIRHERINLQFGFFFNIQVHSYLSMESRHKSQEDPSKPGQSRHFDVYIFRNSDLIGGKPFEHFTSLNFPLSQGQSFNEISRDNGLINFLCNMQSLTELKEHKFGIQLLSKSLKTLCRDNADLVPIEKFEIDSLVEELMPEEILK